MYRRLKLAATALALTTCTAHAQQIDWDASFAQNKIVPIQQAQPQIVIQQNVVIQRPEVVTPAMMIQRETPEDRQKRWDAEDAEQEHMNRSFRKFQKQWDANFNCKINSWHPENCD